LQDKYLSTYLSSSQRWIASCAAITATTAAAEQNLQIEYVASHCAQDEQKEGR
jgi:hypothetical protein